MMENRSFMNKYAMQYGTYMGIFWIIKFTLFPLGLSVPFLEFFFLILTLLVPFVGYYFTKMYRDRICGGFINFGHAWVFATFMYMFSALLTAVGHFVYFRFMDNGFIVTSYLDMLHAAGKNQAVTAGLGSSLKQFEETINALGNLRPIEITIQLLSQNVIYGSLLALPTAFFVKKRAAFPIEDSEVDSKDENNQDENKE
nr:DUF4199 domain-containing protein [uncultured Bacteroides sp.]